MALYAENGLASKTSGGDDFITRDFIATGALHWVDSVNGDDGNVGTENAPLATLAQAIANATANNGDVILIKSGHAETLTSAIDLSKAGIKIFGLGAGSSAPSFTLDAAVDGVTVTAANVEINNLYFPAGTTAVNTAKINVDAANVKIKGCTFVCGVNDSNAITLTANALNAKIESVSMSVTVDGPDTGISVESASAAGLTVKNCSFSGGPYNWDLAAIYSPVAHTNFVYDSISLTKNAAITHTAAAKGYLSNIVAADGSQVQA